MPHSKANLNNLFAGALGAGTISNQTSTLLTGHLGQVVVAGAAGMDSEDIEASDITLITVLLDASSSIAGRSLEQAVRDGQNQLLEAFRKSNESDSILLAQWIFNHEETVLHAYLPLEDAVALDKSNYQSRGTTRLYDTWCDALASNVAYAQQLRDSGTPCRSVVVVITDGEDVGSSRRAADCAKISRDLLASEQFVLAFVGVGNDADFKGVAKSMGVPDGCVEVLKNATASTLRRAFQMVSQSAIRASQGLVQPGHQAGFFAP
jgi:uncharacterized protein YegL